MINWIKKNYHLVIIVAISIVMYVLLANQIGHTTAAIERTYMSMGGDGTARATQLFQLMEYQQSGLGFFGTIIIFFVSGLIAAAGLKAVQFIPFVKNWVRGDDSELSEREQLVLLLSYVALWVSLFVTIIGVARW